MVSSDDGAVLVSDRRRPSRGRWGRASWGGGGVLARLRGVVPSLSTRRVVRGRQRRVRSRGMGKWGPEVLLVVPRGGLSVGRQRR